jgi:hypothetical protein
MTLEQRPTPINPAPATGAVPSVPEPRRASRASLSAEELEALREVWSTPLIPQPAVPRPALLH